MTNGWRRGDEDDADIDVVIRTDELARDVAERQLVLPQDADAHPNVARTACS